jgi:bifunctional non-homologous end joining protein LigD
MNPSPRESTKPMLATLGDLPTGDDWVYEIKWDGVRARVEIDSDRALRIFARSGTEITSRYPELESLADAIVERALPVVLDGEIVAFDADGRPDFGSLQHRMHLNAAPRIEALAAEEPVSYAIFDVLEAGGVDLVEEPWSQRRDVLEALRIDADHVSVPAVYEDGPALLEQMISRGMEGIVAKRRGSLYRPGKVRQDWIKVKPKARQEFLIGGWTAGTGHREGSFGALLLGYYENDQLRYAGNVGSGFDDRALAELMPPLETLETTENPFDSDVTGRGVHFAEPQLVAEIEFSELTGEGHLRHPVFKGLRDDKAPADVVLERKD